MIHDAKVEISCDSPACRTCTYVGLPAGGAGTYLFSESKIEEHLQDDDWIVRDGNHYCSEECAELDLDIPASV